MNKIINYHTKSLKDKQNECSYTGYLAHDITPGLSKSKVFKSESTDLMQAELAAIKMALLDIESNYDPETRYNIYTQSMLVIDLIADNDFNKYSEVQEINNILDKIGQNVGMFEFVGRQSSFTTGNRMLGINKAHQVSSGNNLMESTLRWAKHSGVADSYTSTPFVIKL